ncbi:hypothetical protein [Flavobacterium faecale]|uniref:hypothetical protein n=1 Tax=Flavobacterium faecale TaxID=1355330 RepID=UPI00131F0043|nr:hypothetical protein [Flavobacterium faecale]
MKIYQPFLLLFIIVGFSSCIQEDIVNDEIDASIRINNSFSNFKVNDQVALDAFFFDNLGMRQTVAFDLKSSNPATVEVDNANKIITGKALGTAVITVSTLYAGVTTTKETTVTVNAVTVNPGGTMPTNSTAKVGTITKTSSYASAGDFEIVAIANGIRITFASNYVADQTLPGFAMYLTNNPNSISGALKIDSQGDSDGVIYKGIHSIDVIGVGINDFGYLTHWCEPFRIKVGQAEIKNK